MNPKQEKEKFFPKILLLSKLRRWWNVSERVCLFDQHSWFKGRMAALSPHLTWDRQIFAFFLFNLQNTCNFHCKFKISKCQTNIRNKSFCIFCTFYTPRLVAKNQELNYWNNLIIFLVLAGNYSQFSPWASFSVSFFLKLHWGGGEGSHKLEMEPFSIEMVNGEEKLIIALPHYLENIAKGTTEPRFEFILPK